MLKDIFKQHGIEKAHGVKTPDSKANSNFLDKI